MESLQKLQLDYLDLLLARPPMQPSEQHQAGHPCTRLTSPEAQVHWPMRPDIINQTWAELEALVDAGLVRSIGVSNFSPEKVEQWFNRARIRPAVNQVRPPLAGSSSC